MTCPYLKWAPPQPPEWVEEGVHQIRRERSLNVHWRKINSNFLISGSGCLSWNPKIITYDVTKLLFKHWSEEIARLMMVKLILKLLILTARSTTSSMFVNRGKNLSNLSHWSTRILILAREKIVTNGGHFGGD